MEERVIIEVERLGECQAWREVVRGEYYQWHIKHGFVEVVGDYCYDNIKAFNNALIELKKRFKI